jgi:hypothetical protein
VVKIRDMDWKKEGNEKGKSSKERLREKCFSLMTATLTLNVSKYVVRYQTVIPKVADRHSDGNLENFGPQRTA